MTRAVYGSELRVTTGPFSYAKHYDPDGVVRLRLGGEIDHDVADALSMIITDVLAEAGPHTLVIDLGRVSFLAAAGIRVLLTGREAAHRSGYALRIVNAGTTVRHALVAAGLGGLVRPDVPAPTRTRS